MKKRFKKFISILKEFKFEILMTLEVIALVFSAIYYAFGRKKQFSFLTAVSALLGAYISTSALYKINSSIKSRRFIDIISAANKSSDVLDENEDLDEDDEIIFELEDDGIIEDND